MPDCFGVRSFTLSGENNSSIYVSLDLEMNQPSGKIIEIGVTVADILSREILGKKHFFVNPEEQLSEYIIKLTTIKDEDVQQAKLLPEAYEELCLFLSQFNHRKNIITWGGGDHYVLKEQLESYKRPFEWVFGYSYINAKTIFQCIMIANGKKYQGGLSTCLKKTGVNFKGTKHRAIDDSYNTMIIYFNLLDLLKTINLKMD
jgi:inhibitor of KinA sporulation pathway (predicted exonuclease)